MNCDLFHLPSNGFIGGVWSGAVGIAGPAMQGFWGTRVPSGVQGRIPGSGSGGPQKLKMSYELK